MQQYFAYLENEEIKLKNEDLYHLCKVLRKNDTNICVVLSSKQYLCHFTGSQQDYKISIIEEINKNENDYDITLYQALIRNENFDLAIQKATELGVSTITPTIFERNVVVLTKDKEDKKIERYITIVKNASEQSRRLTIPTVTKQMNVKDISLEDGEVGILSYEKETQDLSQFEKIVKDARKIKVVIGPEGGITKDEADTLIKKGFISVSLGNLILRSETASQAVLSIIGYIKRK